ncbi:hypothetical protein B0F90DRAFT_1652294 [Multifurca ochricompacta]|uniref:DUF1793-domain-containing protein n=1 Tax=Multifurca ochricompacta TaxID=376703 RepID=A0AAD4LTY3_9AGAM|nr:hypothetical protein B0F90DRAFT_1652294 [Multifurca ochricompacta]
MSLVFPQLKFTFLLLALFSIYGRAQQTIFPAAIPLAVRSPYLNCWEYTTNGTVRGKHWPTTYDPLRCILGWSVLVRVDGITYSFLGGVPGVNATVNLTNTVVTPTQTVLSAEAGNMQVNLTFLNPIEPKDWVRQSIPFSYLAFTAKSLDGAAHAVQVYSDVSGEWNSGDTKQVILWSATSTADIIYHTVRLQTPAVFNEIRNLAEWGNLYYAMKSGDNVTHKIAQDTVSRGLFMLNGVLDNQEETNFRPISTNFAVFAISRDLGTIQVTQSPVVWTVGYTTDPAVNYTDLSGAPPQQRKLYYKLRYSDDSSLIIDFLNDFSNASSRAEELDLKILQAAASISDLLGDLTSLATAQVFGSTQITIGTDANGNFNESDVMVFMKNIGGEKPNRVNAVETLFSSFPAFLYIDPTLGAPLLEPLFRLQASSNYSIPFAAADLGSGYPNISGSNANHNQGVEQTGNMLIMTYAHVRASGDGSLINKYYPILTSWANYLSNSSLFIHEQSSADGLSATNQTNLAIKGIIAIYAMSKLSSIVKNTADADKYSNAAARLYGQWKSLALGSDQHLLAVYNQENSWTLGYNLFADVWLGTNLVESSIYDGQSSFINNIALTSTFSNFGIPVDSLGSDTSVTISGWNLFTAAIASNQDLRTNIITNIHNRASFNVSPGVFPLSYDSIHGSTILGVASPAQGAMFAPLALKAPILPINANISTTNTSSKASHTGAVVGGILGGIGALFLVTGAIAFVWRRRRRNMSKSVRSSFSSVVTEAGQQMAVTPFNPSLPEATQLNAMSWTERQSGPFQEATTFQVGNTNDPSPTSLPLHPTLPSVPIGLSGKELARLRTEALRSQRTHSRSASNTPQPNSSPTVTTEGSVGTSSSETRRLQSEVESLRREMQRLREERHEAPPSYMEDE